MTFLLPLLTACAPSADTAEDLFWVEEVEPADGTIVPNALVLVSLYLSDAPDVSRCTLDTLRVDAVRDDGSVAFSPAVELDVSGERFLMLKPVGPYLAGWTYQISAEGGADGCADVDGVPITPFASTFEVP